MSGEFGSSSPTREPPGTPTGFTNTQLGELNNAMAKQTQMIDRLIILLRDTYMERCKEDEKWRTECRKETKLQHMSLVVLLNIMLELKDANKKQDAKINALLRFCRLPNEE